MSFFQGSTMSRKNKNQINGKVGCEMTVVNNAFCNDRCFIEISGHACRENGESYSMPFSDSITDEGDNLACAAVSILVMTVTEKLLRLDSEGAFRNSSITVEPGYACFDLDIRDEYEDEVAYIFETVMLGFELLEENYPDCVSVK